MAKPSKEKIQNQSIDLYYCQSQDLGEGGNATVVIAASLLSDEVVAVKKLRARGAEKEARFLDEIEVMISNKDVPGILPVIDSDLEHCWYSMPLAQPIMKWSNDVLAGCKPKQYRWDEPDIAPWLRAVGEAFIQLAETLTELHRKGVHHRDIKPDNIYFYNGRACLGDFGLVEFPDSNNNLTRNDKGLGAIFTIAPEMKRNPKDSDGAKADVYSLAKTMWMVLSGDEKGFDGQYSSTDTTHGLRYVGRLKHEYLVQIEKLLKEATSNNPSERPDMKSFMELVKKWLELYADEKMSDADEWKFIANRIFRGRIPRRAVFDDPAEIVGVLNILAESSALNHIMFPGGGGLDLMGAELAAEEGFIAVNADNTINILKPQCLYFESFSDPRWNYFFLEAEEAKPVESLPISYWGEQNLVEDFPGHYVCADDSIYGVYDYDSGKPLPQGAKIVTRFCRGKFLIVFKTGTYNYIQATYDGRHNVMSNDELRSYFSYLQKGVEILKSRGLDELTALSVPELCANPFPERMTDRLNIGSDDSSRLLPAPHNFIRNNFTNWNFSDLLPADSGTGKLAFRFEFEPEVFRSVTKKYPIWYLASDGRIHELKDCSPEHFTVYDRITAVTLKEALDQRIKDLCKENNFAEPTLKFCFDIIWERIGMPSHLFTKEELEAVLRNADDRVNNQLVIDEDGYLRLITESDDLSGSLFPVSHETWGARHNYVGKYATLCILDSEYVNCLSCWLDYLKTGRRQYCDYDRSGNPEDFISGIEKLMSKSD